MYNTCRPFLLYNHFLPPSKEVHDWQYLSFGYYDGIDVEENLFSAKSQGTLCEGLAELWNYYVGRNEKLDGSFSEQIVLGLRTENEETRIKDNEFWKDKNRAEYPFLFFVLIQADDKKKKDAALEIERLEIELSNETRKVITYFTFDTSDLLMVMLCKEYDGGIKAIENLHQATDNRLENVLGWELKYSFSIAAINKKIVNNKEQVNKITGSIQRADIYLIEKKLGAIDSIYEKLKTHIEDSGGGEVTIGREAVLGCNDEVIKLENIPWSKFLLLYQDKKGFFDNSNEDYYKGLIGVTTIIHSAKLSGKRINIQESKSKDALLSKVMRKKCKEITFDDISGGYADISGIKRNMFQVINSLQKFEETPLRDYLFQSALLPLNMMLDMAKEVASETEKRKFTDSFYVFMKGFNLFVQDSGRSDRQFTQVPDFNARIYDTPVKINAFYNAFIFYMKNYLNELYSVKSDSDNSILHEYEFLACPGVTDNMQVRECFAGVSENKRLFLVEIPEKQVYKPKQMLIMLAHEVAHFVGSDVRNRKKRFDCMIDICVELIINCLKLRVKEIVKADNAEHYQEIYSEISTEEFWKIFRERFQKKIKLNKEEYKKEYIDKFAGEGKNGELSAEEKEILEKGWECRKYHSDVVVDFLRDLITDKLCGEGEELWAYMVEKYHLSLVKRGFLDAEYKKECLRVKLNQYVAEIASIPIWNNEKLTISSAMINAMSVFKECIADLICILTLRLSLEDYLNTIISSAKDQGMTVDIKENQLMFRVMLIVACMEKRLSVNDIVWEDGQIDFYEKPGKEEISVLWTGIRNMKDEFLEKGEKILQSQLEEKEERTLKAIDALYDCEVLKIFLEYLCKCKEDFIKNDMEKLHFDERKEHHNKVKQAYELFDKAEIEQILFDMIRLTESYLWELQELNSKAAEENSGSK